MKRKLLTAVALILSVSAMNAQGMLDAYRFSQRDLRGTARFMSLGGAMGARGGDISAISVNPAGIATYKSYEAVTTLDFQNSSIQSKFSNNSDKYKENKFKVKFNNFAFVGTVPIYNDVVPLVNFGFSYNRVMSFDKKYRMSGNDLSRRLIDYMSERADVRSGNPENINLHGVDDLAANSIWRGEDWLSIFGYNSNLIVHNNQDGYIPFDIDNRLKSANDLFVEERGSIDSYDLNMGATFENLISAGITISFTDIDYRMDALYKEDFYVGKDGTGDMWNGYDLVNKLQTKGDGLKFSLGAIFKPSDEFRIGIAYHSPTWYNLTDHSYATLDHNLTDLSKNVPNLLLGNYPEGGGQIYSMSQSWSRYEYELRTPDKWVFSLSGAIGKVANISLDYELTDYTKSKFKDDYSLGSDNLLKDYIKNFYQLTSTVRAGVEFSFTPSFFGRLGYSWQQSPYSTKLTDYLNPQLNKDDNFDTAGSVAQYVIEKDAHYFTWGLGYRLTRNFYADLGFIYKNQKGDLYTHSFSDLTELTQNTFQGALTMGLRF